MGIIKLSNDPTAKCALIAYEILSRRYMLFFSLSENISRKHFEIQSHLVEKHQLLT